MASEYKEKLITIKNYAWLMLQLKESLTTTLITLLWTIG